MQPTDDPLYIKQYMNAGYDASGMRKAIPFVLGLTDAFLFFAAVGELFPMPLLMILVSGLIPVHALGLLLMMFPYRYQAYGRLFIGLYAIMSSLVFLFFGVELMVLMLGKWWLAYRATLFTAYAVWIAVLLTWHLGNYRNGCYAQTRKENPRLAHQRKRIGTASSVFFIVHVLFGLLTGTFVPATEMAVVLLIAAGLPYFAQHLHRFLLIRRHPDLLIIQEPYIRLSKHEHRLARKQKKSVGTVSASKPPKGKGGTRDA